MRVRHVNFSRQIEGAGICRLRIRRGDGQNLDPAAVEKIVASRMKNGIPRKPMIRLGDSPENRHALLASRRQNVQACLLADNLIKENAQKVEAGQFTDTCGPLYLEENNLVLRQDRYVLPLTIGVLKKLADSPCVQEIFLRGEGTEFPNCKKADHGLAGWLSVYDAINLAELINLSLQQGKFRVRLAPEILVSAFLHAVGNKESFRSSPIILTANHFLHDGAAAKTFHAGVLATRVDEKIVVDRKSILVGGSGARIHAFIYRNFNSSEILSLGRWAQPPDAAMNSSVVFEVYES